MFYTQSTIAVISGQPITGHKKHKRCVTFWEDLGRCPSAVPVARESPSGRHSPLRGTQETAWRWTPSAPPWPEVKELGPGFLHPVNRSGSPQVDSHSHSYSIPGRNASHPNTRKKLAHSSTHNTVNSKHNQAQNDSQIAHFNLYISLIRNWESYFWTDSQRHIQYKIKTQLIKSKVCLIHCYDAQ